MRRVLVVAVVAIAAVALYVTTAPAGEQAVTPKQFAALQKRVTKLEKTNNDIIDVLGLIATCVFDKGAIATTKAPQYHIPATGEVADFYVLTTNNQDCVNLINNPAAMKLLHRVAH
jgi:hypothetical protein